MTITAFYAALLAFVFIYLSVRTIRLRRHFKIAVGHGNNHLLERAMRAHANFAEYAPFALLLTAMLESVSQLPWLTHGLGLTLLAGRIVHAYGVSQAEENLRYRVAGMTMTFAVLGVSGLGILISLLLK